MDYSCDECYRMRRLHITECPQCGEKACFSQVIGLSCILKCSNCDFDVVGVSFHPACWDDTLYSIFIDKPDDSRKMVKLARILNMKVLELNKLFVDSGGNAEIKLKTRDCAKVCKQISEQEISYSLSQDLLRDYSRILDCPFING